MPHKRAKGSARGRERAPRPSFSRTTDSVPKTSIEHEPIPKSVSRVLEAGRIRREYRRKKRQLDGVSNSDEGDRQQKKTRHDVIDMKGDGESTALRIKPGETVSEFNRRVESSMMPLIKTALEQSSAQVRRVRKEAAQAMLKQSKQGDKGRHAQRGSSKKGLDPPPAKGADEESAAPRQTKKEFEVVSTSAPRRLNDVAEEPPAMKKLPRGATRGDASEVLSLAQKAMMEGERDKAIKRYREMKARRLRESGGGKVEECD